MCKEEICMLQWHLDAMSREKKKNFVYEPNLKYQSSVLYGYEEVH